MAIDPARLLGWPFPEVHQTYAAKDTILYALGVGCGADPDDLRYVYEQDLQALPSMAATLGYPGFWLRDPAAGVDWRMAVHAGQSIELLRPLPAAASVIGRNRVAALWDKGPGKGALLVTERDILEAGSGEPIARLRHTAFLRGQGGFGGEPGPAQAGDAPQTPPEASIALATLPQAALIYRLSGDLNPLHADPAVAAAAGFARPILHGLCTLGVVTRALLRDGGDAPARLRRLEARFAQPAYPGETITTHLWRQPGRTLFRAEAGGRPVLQGGVAEWGAL